MSMAGVLIVLVSLIIGVLVLPRIIIKVEKNKKIHTIVILMYFSIVILSIPVFYIFFNDYKKEISIEKNELDDVQEIYHLFNNRFYKITEEFLDNSKGLKFINEYNCILKNDDVKIEFLGDGCLNVYAVIKRKDYNKGEFFIKYYQGRVIISNLYDITDICKDAKIDYLNNKFSVTIPKKNTKVRFIENNILEDIFSYTKNADKRVGLSHISGDVFYIEIPEGIEVKGLDKEKIKYIE